MKKPSIHLIPVVLITMMIIVTSCSIFSGVSTCPTYTYTYRCLEDDEIACTKGPAVFYVGEVFVSPVSGHRCIIVSEGCK